MVVALMFNAATLLPGVYTSLGIRLTERSGFGKSRGFRAAELERGSGRARAQGGSADRHLEADRELLGDMAERFERNNGVYETIVNRAVEGIMGAEGFRLQMMTGDDALNETMEADWNLFAKNPEVRGLFSFQDMGRLSLRSVINHGDIGIAALNTRRFQAFESEQIAGGRRASDAARNGGRIRDGVEMDRFGTPLAYWVSPFSDGGFVQRAKARRFRAENFVFPAYRKRYSATRGTPVLVTSFSNIHRLNDILDAEAIAWQLLSRFALAITRKDGAQRAFKESSQDEDGRDPPPASGVADVSDRFQDYEQGTVYHGEIGEEVKPIDRAVPGGDFSDNVRMYLRLVGMPLGLPLEVILNDYSNTTYLSARAALEQAFRVFVAWQRDMKRWHHSPLLTHWIRWGIAAGTYPDKSTTFDHDWSAPEFPWIDQLKEAEAWEKRIGVGLATQTQALSSVNMDRSEYLVTRSREVKEAIETAEAINKEFPGANVDWRMFCGQAVSKSQGVMGPADAAPPMDGNKKPDDDQDPPEDEGDEPEDEGDEDEDDENGGGA